MIKRSFAGFHPLTDLLFFCFVIGFTMFFTHPVCLAVSLICALINAAVLNGKKTALFLLRFVLPMMIFIGVINPVFNHQGATILAYLPWGNPLTLESILYGVFAGVMTGAVMLWFSAFNAVMTSDRLVCLFGRAAPALGLVISMTLRFVPRFFARAREIRAAQESVYTVRSGFVYKLRGGVRTLSALITLSLEDALDTADSMRGRGYGLKGRTSYSLYRFHARDAAAIAVMTVCAAAMIAMLAVGAVSFRYFPSCKGTLGGIYSVLYYIIFGAVGAAHLIIGIGEGVSWKRSRSRI